MSWEPWPPLGCVTSQGLTCALQGLTCATDRAPFCSCRQGDNHDLRQRQQRLFGARKLHGCQPGWWKGCWACCSPGVKDGSWLLHHVRGLIPAPGMCIPGMLWHLTPSPSSPCHCFKRANLPLSFSPPPHNDPFERGGSQELPCGCCWQAPSLEPASNHTPACFTLGLQLPGFTEKSYFSKEPVFKEELCVSYWLGTLGLRTHCSLSSFFLACPRMWQQPMASSRAQGLVPFVTVVSWPVCSCSSQS